MADLSQPAELRVETHNEPPGVAVVSVAGELDVSNAETLESVVDAGLRRTAGRSSCSTCAS